MQQVVGGLLGIKVHCAMGSSTTVELDPHCTVHFDSTVGQ